MFRCLLRSNVEWPMTGYLYRSQPILDYLKGPRLAVLAIERSLARYP